MTLDYERLIDQRCSEIALYGSYLTYSYELANKCFTLSLKIMSLLSPYPVAVSLIRIKQNATSQGLLQSDILSQMESIFFPVLGSIG